MRSSRWAASRGGRPQATNYAGWKALAGSPGSEQGLLWGHCVGLLHAVGGRGVVLRSRDRAGEEAESSSEEEDQWGEGTRESEEADEY